MLAVPRPPARRRGRLRRAARRDAPAAQRGGLDPAARLVRRSADRRTQLRSRPCCRPARTRTASSRPLAQIERRRPRGALGAASATRASPSSAPRSRRSAADSPERGVVDAADEAAQRGEDPARLALAARRARHGGAHRRRRSRGRFPRDAAAIAERAGALDAEIEALDRRDRRAPRAVPRARLLRLPSRLDRVRRRLRAPPGGARARPQGAGCRGARATASRRRAASDVRAIFVQPQFSRESAELVAGEIGAQRRRRSTRSPTTGPRTLRAHDRRARRVVRAMSAPGHRAARRLVRVRRAPGPRGRRAWPSSRTTTSRSSARTAAARRPS